MSAADLDGNTPLGNGVPLGDNDSIDDSMSTGDCGSPASSYPGSPLPEASFIPTPTVKDQADIPLTTRSLASADSPDLAVEQHPIRAVVRVRPFSTKDPTPLKP
ncbi:MAG: hypothetical protein Q8J97_00570, partial [Flavobacteriaceae bacterium]|nr:hypothetical protein [Flavobacteriaceae bacterium]